jgi:superfamily II DNA/RNA helicase
MAEALHSNNLSLTGSCWMLLRKRVSPIPTDIQQKCIPVILGGQEVIGIAQTGTGKTAAYLLPVLMKVKYAQGDDPRAVILVPTKELTLQIAEHAVQLAKYTDLRILSFVWWGWE